MKLNYRQLRQFIEPVDLRNKNRLDPLGIDSIKGVSSIFKSFIKTKANLIGVNPGNYKVVKPYEFAFNPNTARMGDKIPIALNVGSDDILVSSIYPTFKIVDCNELHPEYLMMWFRRPEFDRYARFKSHGSAREIFDFEEMLSIELPVPPIEKQRAIVKEYNTIVNRIKLNEKLNQKLEETAQALYKHWFVDFEFPDENGQPYKSSGGEMVYNVELDQEIPLGWSYNKLDSLTNQICVAYVGSVYAYYCEPDEGIPMLRTTDITEDGLSYKDLRHVTSEFHQKQKKSQLSKGDLLVARHGSNGMPVIFDEEFEANALNVIIIKPDQRKMTTKLLHCFLNSDLALKHIKSSLGGSVQEVLNTKKIADLKVVFPNHPENYKYLFKTFEKIQSIIEKSRKSKYALEELLSISSTAMLRSNTRHNEIH